MGTKRAGGARRSGSGSVDSRQLARALSYPGIDPRMWVSQAVVASAISVEGEEGVFVDVLLLPSLAPMTVRVAPVYAGNGFGLYAPLLLDDEVTVLVPSGDPDEGGILVARCWSPSDVPPPEAVESPEDVVLVIEENKNIQVVVKGSGELRILSKGSGAVRVDAAGTGNVEVTASGSGKVLLGTDAASRAVARVQDDVNSGILSFVTTPATPSPGFATNSLLWTPAGGGIPQVLAVFVSVGVATVGAVQLAGKIVTGSAKVDAT